MKFKNILMSLSLLSISIKSNAQVLFIQDGAPIFVQVDHLSGATIEFPMPVKMVPIMPKYFNLKAQKAQGVAESFGQQKAPADDVTIFSISPNSNKQDSAVFLLSNGKSIQVSFIPSSSTISDSFYQLKYPKNVNNTNYASNAKYFLSDEKNLMISMLKDDSKYGRKKITSDLEIKEYPQLEFKLVREFQSNKLQGYVFKVKNKSDNLLQINPTVLKIGNPNQIIMIQNDHDLLDSCQKNSDPSPTGTGCFSIMRIVVKNDSNLNDMDFNNNFKLPFLVKPKNEKGN